MYKVFEVRATEEKTFAKLVREFNSILTANGMEAIRPVRLGGKDIKCTYVPSRFSGHLPLDFTVPGSLYAIDIADEILSFNGHTPIGSFTKIGAVWTKHTLTNNPADIADVSEANFRCDHCGKNIKNRNGYWFFRREDGELVVVGSTCVQKFFGINPEELLKKLGKLLVFEENSGRHGACGKREIPTFSLKVCYALTKYFTKNFQYWEKKEVGKAGTAQKVKDTLFHLLYATEFSDEYVKLYDYVVSKLTVNDEKYLELAKFYWQNARGDSDFAVNTKNVIGAGRFAISLAGYAAFGLFKAVSSYNTKKMAPAAPQGDFIGSLKERMNRELTAVKSTHFTREICIGWKTEYQEASRLQFVDAAGNVFVSFCSSDKMIDVAESHLNQPYTYRFTVVEHRTEKNGQKTNIINRLA